MNTERICFITNPDDTGLYPPDRINVGHLTVRRGMTPGLTRRIIEVLIGMGINEFDASHRGDWHLMNSRHIRDTILGVHKGAVRPQSYAPTTMPPTRDYLDLMSRVSADDSVIWPTSIVTSMKEDLLKAGVLGHYFTKEPQDMSNNTNPKFDAFTGSPLPQPYQSRILTGTELVVGQIYRLEVIGNPGKAPENAKAGANYRAIGDSDGSFSGEVLADNYSVFKTDASDLWLKA